MTGSRTASGIATLGLWLALAAVRPGAAAPGSADSLDDLLLPMLRQHDGVVAAAVRQLDSGVAFAFEADRRMPTASLVKLPVMVAAYAAERDGTVKLSDRVVLEGRMMVPGSVVLDKLSPGADFTLRDAIRMMIASSDNTATNIVLERIGLESPNRVLDELQLPGIRLNSFVYRGDTTVDPERSREFGLGCGTAADFVRLLGMIHSAQLERDGVVAEGACREMLDHLLACEDRGTAGRDLPPGFRIAHKTGLVSGVRTDAGIILGPTGPIAFCLLTARNADRRAPNGPADDLAARFGRAVVDHFLAAAARSRPPVALAQGARGVLVEELQRALDARRGDEPPIVIDGEFGPATDRAVRSFQRRCGLPETGTVDAATWRALGTLPSTVADEGDPPPPTRADNPADPPAVTSAAWAVTDAASGELLFGHEADAPRRIASIVKVMTAVLAIEEAQRHPAVLDETVVVSDRAGAESGSSAQLRPGDRLTVRELLFGMLLPSGNDAAMVVAEHFGGRMAGDGDPVAVFVARMNDRARQLGLARTRYANPHGKTAADDTSTASDTARLARLAMALPLFREIVATRRRAATLDNDAGFRRDVVWRSTNRLLGIEGYAGIKTGTTTAAGCCLAAYGERQGRPLVVVVLGAPSTEARYVDVRNLFGYAWRRLGIP